jgi:hypothetical protein
MLQSSISSLICAPQLCELKRICGMDSEANASGEYQIDAEDERVVLPVSPPSEELTTTPS